ncbi:hypothetical protein LXL04_007651 [Taraxacum kok-saghyz]
MMRNPFKAIFSGVGHVVGNLFGAPLDFLSGKSCNSKCGPTWDLPCYIENFCIQHLIKLASVSLLFYIVILFFYLLYKLRLFHCISHMACKMVRACVSAFFLAWERGCELMCHILCDARGKRRRRKRDIEMADMSTGSNQETDTETSFSYRNNSRRRLSLRDHKRKHFRKSLKPKNHRLRVGVDGDSVYASKRKHIKHGDVRVHKTSSFTRKGASHKKSRRR